MALSITMRTLMILAVVLPAYSQPADNSASLLQINKKTGEEKTHQVQSQKIGAEKSHQLQSQKTGAEQTHQLQSKENATLVTPKKSKPLKKKPVDSDADAGSTGTFTANVPRIVYQLVFGILYYFMIVSKYPYPMAQPFSMPKRAIDIQDMDPVSATCEVSLPNLLYSYLCSGPRAAHTFYGAGVAGYWTSLICMSIFPCCVLFAANSCTDLNEKLGGQKQNILMGALCSFCCSCCMIAQDAETLDVINGVETGFLGVSSAPNV